MYDVVTAIRRERECSRLREVFLTRLKHLLQNDFDSVEKIEAADAGLKRWETRQAQAAELVGVKFGQLYFR